MTKGCCTALIAKDPKSIKKAQDSAPATFVSFSLGTWRRLKTACSRRKKLLGEKITLAAWGKKNTPQKKLTHENSMKPNKKSGLE